MSVDCHFTLRLKDNSLKHYPSPSVMGIINASLDSFYSPVRSVSDALFEAEKMIKQGASILDVGGVATNPSVNLEILPSVQQELDRVLPIIETIAQNFDTLISVDTSEPAVMRAAVNSGAGFINDQRMLQVPGAAEAVLELNVPVCLMHAFVPAREPGSSSPQQCLKMIKNDLAERVEYCKKLGIDPQRIVIDPGFGQGHYGKNLQENFYLLGKIKELTALSCPILIGWSRKSMVGEALGGVPPQQRLYGSIAAASLGGFLGASIIRVHDVEETAQAMMVIRAVHRKTVYPEI
jgi:dihydropteroate synthase